jgi:DNA repair exonuclease SbcCD ATPase subunit
MIEEYEETLASYINENEQYKKTVSDLQHINEMQAKEIAKLEQAYKELKEFLDKKTV